MSEHDKWDPITKDDWEAWWAHKNFPIYHCNEVAGVICESTSSYSYARCTMCSAVWTSWFNPMHHGMQLWKLRAPPAPEPRYKLTEVTDGKVRYTKLIEIK
jgi:hypothetical protein